MRKSVQRRRSGTCSAMARRGAPTVRGVFIGGAEIAVEHHRLQRTGAGSPDFLNPLRKYCCTVLYLYLRPAAHMRATSCSVQLCGQSDVEYTRLSNTSLHFTGSAGDGAGLRGVQLVHVLRTPSRRAVGAGADSRSEDQMARRLGRSIYYSLWDRCGSLKYVPPSLTDMPAQCVSPSSMAYRDGADQGPRDNARRLCEVDGSTRGG